MSNYARAEMPAVYSYTEFTIAIFNNTAESTLTFEKK